MSFRGGVLALPTIVHLDADAFFVSVEQALNPALKGRKVAVGGRGRGIISSASYEARACGVYTPMPTARALRVCPDLILVEHGSGSYGEFSRRLFDLCGEVTPLVERRSIDEGFMDVTPCGHRSLEEVVAAVRGLQGRISEELDVGVSFGLATNKLVAGIASKLNKPRGFTVVEPGGEAAFLAPLWVGRLPGVGPRTEEALRARGVKSVADILALGEDEARGLFGGGWRGMMEMARGVDESVVVTESGEAKSYSQQETFARDVGDFAEVERVAKGMIDALMREVRGDGKRVRTLAVKVRYPNFEQMSASHSLREATCLEQPFYPWVGVLLRQAWARRGVALRLVSVRLSGVDEGPRQLDLFASAANERRQRLAGVVDALNAGARRHGAPRIVHGGSVAFPRK